MKKLFDHRLARFIACLIGAIMLLALDLGVKEWAFSSIAEHPLRLVRQPASVEHDLHVEAYVQDDWVSVTEVLWPAEGDGFQIISEPNQLPSVRKEAVPVLWDWALVLNRGSLFGFLQGKRMLLLLLGFVALVIMLVSLWRMKLGRVIAPIAMMCVLSGAFGNLYDRFTFGAVRDMFFMLPDVKLPFGLTYPGGHAEIWPWVFNVADVILLIGIGLFFVSNFLDTRAEKKLVAQKNENKPTDDALEEA